MIENNPFYKIFWLLLVGLLVFVILRVLQRYVLALVKKRKYLRLIDRWEFRLKTAIWIGYLSWALFHMIKVNFLVTLVILAVILIAGWRSWMEFYAGMVLRLERRIQVGDTIETPQSTGVVEQFFFQSLSILSDDGRLVYIPYSIITEDVVKQSTDREKLMAQSFSLQIETDSPDEVRLKLSHLVISCPWTAVTQPVQISDDGNGRFQITAKAIDNAVFYKLESYVRRRVSKPTTPKKEQK